MKRPDFLPNKMESELIKIIQKYNRNEFTLIRMTFTMLDKCIIDASKPVVNILKDNNIFNYDYAEQGGEKEIISSLVITDTITKHNISVYKAKKRGDNRFWIKDKFNHLVSLGTLIYISTFNSQMIIIPLCDSLFDEQALLDLYGKNTDDIEIIHELLDKLSTVRNKGYIESVCTDTKQDKDVGETLETALGLKINNLVSADYKGKIEIKAKRESSKTNDTLFCKVPDWDISEEKTIKDIVLKYGYPDARHTGCTKLAITINTKPNKQGFFIEIDEDIEIVSLYNNSTGKNNLVCSWRFETLKESLFTKHPKTVWILAEEKKLSNKIHFKYKEVQLTQNPIFSQFISLIQQNIITFDLRSSYYNTGKLRKDYGQAFRLKPRYRNLLFGECEIIDFDNLPK